MSDVEAALYFCYNPLGEGGYMGQPRYVDDAKKYSAFR